jgi:uncharacterized protein GlcG (DUF336 family)
MLATDTVYLTLGEARDMIARGLDKARELRQAGAIVVIDAGGRAVSISRMDDSPVASVYVSRAKAYLAAVQGRPTAALANNAHERPEIFAAYQAILPQQPFPGAGGMPIVKGGRVVGGIATGAGIGPFTQVPGLDPAKLIVEGGPANAEDLVICTALGIPYASQHGDRPLPQPTAASEPITTPPPLTQAEAKAYADRAIEFSEKRGIPVGVAVVDELGRLLQADRMDESPMGGVELAEAKAMTAVKFRRSGSSLTKEFREHSARLEQVEKVLGFPLLPLGGGLPIFKEGRMVGAIGIAGSGASVEQPGTDEDVAKAALGSS